MCRNKSQDNEKRLSARHSSHRHINPDNAWHANKEPLHLTTIRRPLPILNVKRLSQPSKAPGSMHQTKPTYAAVSAPQNRPQEALSASPRPITLPTRPVA